jgi:hypothetical protein
MKSCRMLAILIVSCLGSATAENYTDKLVGFSFLKLPGWTLDPHAPVLGGDGDVRRHERSGCHRIRIHHDLR